MFRLVFQSFANNEVRVGFDELPYPRRTGGDGKAQREAQHLGEQHDAARLQYLSDNNIVEYRDYNGTLWRSSESGVNPIDRRERANLVITNEVQEASDKESPTGRDKYDKPVVFTSFTRNARHRLLEAGAVCEEQRARGAVGIFVTFTLPGSTFPAYVALAKYSGFVCNRVCQVLRDDKRQKSYFWVWERQKRGALHLHLFISLTGGQKWDDYREPLYRAWYNALSAVGESESCDMFRHRDGEYCTTSHFWRYDYQKVRKSVAGYLSKYVSKDAVRGFADDPEEVDAGLYPRRWWYMSRDLCREINSRRKTIAVEGVSQEELLEAIDCMDAMSQKMSPVATHSYNADIGRSKYRDGSFGTSYRKIFWFRTEEFAEIELALRSTFVRLLSEMRKTRVTFKGSALDYGGQRLAPDRL